MQLQNFNICSLMCLNFSNISSMSHCTGPRSLQTNKRTHIAWCYSDRASWIDYTLITNLMHWLLFIHKILFSSTCFEPQVLIFRRIQLYTCSIWYCHSLWQLMVACRYTAWVSEFSLTQAVYLKMSTWGSKHVQENNILWINNNQCIMLVINT